jgi:hypothetical protein
LDEGEVEEKEKERASAREAYAEGGSEADDPTVPGELSAEELEIHEDW